MVGLDAVFRTVDITLQLRVAQVAQRVDRADPMTDLGSFGGELSRSTAINNSGQAVGYSYTAGNAAIHAFLYDSRGMVDIGTLGGNQSYAIDINNAMQVVGNSNGRAFLYSDGAMYDLNDLVDSSAGWLLSDAGGINDAGQIAVVGFVNGRNHVLLLNPIPEPGTLVLLCAALLAFGIQMLPGVLRRTPRKFCHPGNYRIDERMYFGYSR